MTATRESLRPSGELANAPLDAAGTERIDLGSAAYSGPPPADGPYYVVGTIIVMLILAVITILFIGGTIFYDLFWNFPTHSYH